jgi:hypothetical protein
MKIFKTTAIALVSGLLIGAASMPARSATVKDKVMAVEKMPTKGRAPSSLGVRSPVDEAEPLSSHRAANRIASLRTFTQTASWVTRKAASWAIF